MKTELDLNLAQRNELAKIFKNMVREEKFYDAWGASLKGVYEDSILWYFVPLNSIKLPPVECESREVLNDKEDVIGVVYKFKIELLFPFVKQMKRSIILEKEIDQAILNGIV